MRSQRTYPTEQARNIIGPRLREARRKGEPRITQADIVARVAEYGVKLTRAAVGKIENGTRIVTDYEVRALAAALAVSVSWLLAEEDVHDEGAIVRQLRPRRNVTATTD